MSSIHSKRLLLFVLLPFLFSVICNTPSSAATASPQAASKLIDEVCQGVKNGDYGFCVRTLESDPRAAGADLLGLAQISIEVSSRGVARNLVHTQNLLRLAKDPALKSSLRSCLDLYDTSFFWISEANNFLREKDYRNVILRAKRVHGNAARCEHGLKALRPPVPSPLTSQNHAAEVLAQTLGSAAYLLRGQV
ncbi:putative invertase inhibitor [Aristolochia californica]|uniref:putative invertase inhibitor n=1 Tax=Aristolochia californica TaxID=171875 RepID=UPI0035D6E44D